MVRKDVLKSIDRDSMTRAQKDRFKRMCGKLFGQGTDPSGLDHVQCRLFDKELEVKEDFSSASVHMRNPNTDPEMISGHVDNVERIGMKMIGDPDTDDEVTKIIEVEGENGSVKIKNHATPNRGET